LPFTLHLPCQRSAPPRLYHPLRALPGISCTTGALADQDAYGWMPRT
jgi:hypothetical protein